MRSSVAFIKKIEIEDSKTNKVTKEYGLFDSMGFIFSSFKRLRDAKRYFIEAEEEFKVIR